MSSCDVVSCRRTTEEERGVAMQPRTVSGNVALIYEGLVRRWWGIFMGALAALVVTGCVHTAAFQRPEVIRFGASHAEMDAALAGWCDSKRTHLIHARE